jgi:transcriptional regulator GlxA family with amidase domain
LKKHYPRVDVNANAFFIHDGPIYTSAGVSSGIDLALAPEILRKLYHHDTYESLDANQFLLAVTSKPFDWIYAPLKRNRNC